MITKITSNHPTSPIDGSRREFLVILSRFVLLIITIGFTGFLVARRRCQYDEGYDYTQQICRNCRQLNECEKPPAENYRKSHLTGEERG